MSVIYNPNIISSNCVLYLDAGNKKSYNATGASASWYTLAGTENATMYGNVPFETDGGGCFNFATVTTSTGYSNGASLGFTFSANMIPRSGSFTLSCWVKNPPATGGQHGLFSNTGGGIGYRFGIRQTDIYFLIGPPYGENPITYGSVPFDNTKWHNVVFICDRSGILLSGSPRCYLYLDGNFCNSMAIVSQQGISPTNAPGIVRSPCCGVWDGKLAIFSAYSGILTTNEIKNNYEALKGRFGL